MGFITQVVAILLGIAIYFLPSYVASKRRHHRRRAIYLVNLLLGWSVIGWLAALIWSFTGVNRAVSALDDYFPNR